MRCWWIGCWRCPAAEGDGGWTLCKQTPEFVGQRVEKWRGQIRGNKLLLAEKVNLTNFGAE